MTNTIITARNSKQLSAQIDAANAKLSAMGAEIENIGYGKAISGPKLWYVNGIGGSNLKTGLTFDALVREIDRRLTDALAAEGAE